METPKTAEFALIGKSVVIKGELSGSEDLYVDGQVEGSIELRGNSLTIGPNGQVHANINASGVIVQGKLDGNVQATDRVDLRKSAIMMGDIVTQRIAVEDGAYFKGKVEIQKEPARPEPQPEAKREAVPVGSVASSTSATGSTSSGAPPSVIAGQKK